ncbi:MAG: thiol peroxidase [Candidatus Omnitrophica bacterium]|nr:thiol peroxidase [Candidatus Omnitrophota bacterium]
MERLNTVTLKEKTFTLIGQVLSSSEQAPEFEVLDNDLKKTGLLDFKDKIKIICSVPSLDTPVCDLEIKRFNKEAAALSQDIVIIFISMDLPFAQKRFCQANEIKSVKTFSDHRNADFGTKYGVLIKELRLLARAVFILDTQNTLRYVEYVREISSQPDYDKALAVLKKLV